MKKKQTLTSLGRRNTSFLKDFVRPDSAQTTSSPDTIPSYTNQETPSPCVPATKTSGDLSLAESHCSVPQWRVGMLDDPFNWSVANYGLFLGNRSPSNGTTGNSAIAMEDQDIPYTAIGGWGDGGGIFFDFQISTPEQAASTGTQYADVDLGCNSITGTRFTTASYSFSGGFKSDPPRLYTATYESLLGFLAFNPSFYPFPHLGAHVNAGRGFTWGAEGLAGGTLMYFASEFMGPVADRSTVKYPLFPGDVDFNSLLDEWILFYGGQYLHTGMHDTVTITTVNQSSGAATIYVGGVKITTTMSDGHSIGGGLTGRRIFQGTHSVEWTDIFEWNELFWFFNKPMEVVQGVRNDANSHFDPVTVLVEVSSSKISDGTGQPLRGDYSVRYTGIGNNTFIPVTNADNRILATTEVVRNGNYVSPSYYTVNSENQIVFTFTAPATDSVTAKVTFG